VLAGLLVSTSSFSNEAAQALVAWAAGLKNLTPEQGQTLLKVARDLFPHQELADSSYTVCIDPYDAAALDPRAKAEIQDGLKTVEGASRRIANTAYVNISDDDERIRLAKMLADGRWMGGFKKTVAACPDAQPEVKAKLDHNGFPGR
jgi:hypothetical protein